MTRKRNLAVTLQAAYGDEDAWRLVPRTYSLPSQLQQWRQHLANTAEAGQFVAADSAVSAAAAGGADTQEAAATTAGQEGSKQQTAAAALNNTGQPAGWWVLKTGQHRGQGLRVVPASQALSVSGLAAASDSDSPGNTQTSSSSGSTSSRSTEQAQASPSSQPFLAAQQYITDPLLINNRKFGVRVWVLAIGPKPYRAYVYQQGLVLFSHTPYNPDMPEVATAGAASQVSKLLLVRAPSRAAAAAKVLLV